MNEKIIKRELIRKIVDLTRCRNQKYTQEDVENIITAFGDVVKTAIENGDSIHLNGYITIENKYAPSRKARNVSENTEVMIPERYRIHIKSGSKLNEAVKAFSEKRLGGNA